MSRRYYLFSVIVAVVAMGLIFVVITYLVQSQELSFVLSSGFSLLITIIGLTIALMIYVVRFGQVTLKVDPQLVSYQNTSSKPKTPAEEAIQQRKDAFENLSNVSFFYSNREAIEDGYNHHFREAILESVTTKASSEGKAGGGLT